MILDIRTLMVLWVIINVISAVAVAVLWYRYRGRFAGLTFWLSDTILVAIGGLLILLRGLIPDFISVVIANTLSQAGIILVLMGLERFLGKKGWHIHNYILLGVFITVLTYYAFIQPNLTAREIAISAMVAILTFQCCWLLLKRVSPAMRSLTSLTGIVFASYAVINVARIIMHVFIPAQNNDFFKSGIVDSLALTFYIVLTTCFTLALILMVSDRLLKEVRADEEKFRAAFHSSPYAIIISRLPDGKIIECNDGFVNITGYQCDEVTGKTTVDLRLWAREVDRKAAVNILLSGGSMAGEEFQFRIKSGEIITGLFSADVIMVNNEKCVLSSINNISERKRDEDLIQLRLRLWEFSATHSIEEILVKTLDEVSILVNSPIGFFHFVGDDQKTVSLQAWSTRTTQEFCTAQGKGIHYSLDKAGVWVDCVHQRHPVIHNDYASLPHRKGLPEGHAPVTRELVVPIMRHDKVVAILGVGNKPSDYTEKDVETVGFIADIAWTIAERKLLEEALMQKQKLIEVTIQSTGDGVVTTDMVGRITLLNKVAEQLTGWTYKEASGRPINEVFNIINERTRERIINPVDEVLRTGRIVGLANHAVLVSRDGTERIIADSGAPIRDDLGTLFGVVLIFRDITQIQKLEEEAHKVAKLESVGTLAGGIAHDFNNILTGILGNINLALMETPAKDKITDLLKEAEAASLRAASLTKQLLTFAKGGAPIRKPVVLNAIIGDTATLSIRGSGVNCRLSLASDLCTVDADEGQISQVITNMVLNAQQAMPTGGTIEVKTENIRLSKDQSLGKKILVKEGNYVKISITDHGTGIAPEHLDKIFDPYFTTKPKGSGLGLATSYSIVHKHDGYISVESAVGKGSTFYIYLPVSGEKMPV